MKESLLIERECLQALLDAAKRYAVPDDDNAHHLSTAEVLLAQPTELRPQPSLGERIQFFESACKASKMYSFPLGIMALNGRFSHYIDSDTDSAFAGYRAGFTHGRRWERSMEVIPTAPAAE